MRGKGGDAIKGSSRNLHTRAHHHRTPSSCPHGNAHGRGRGPPHPTILEEPHSPHLPSPFGMTRSSHSHANYGYRSKTLCPPFLRYDGQHRTSTPPAGGLLPISKYPMTAETHRPLPPLFLYRLLPLIPRKRHPPHREKRKRQHPNRKKSRHPGRLP